MGCTVFSAAACPALPFPSTWETMLGGTLEMRIVLPTLSPGTSCRPNHLGKARTSFLLHQHPKTVSCQEAARRKQYTTQGQGLGYASFFHPLPLGNALFSHQVPLGNVSVSPLLPQQHCSSFIPRYSSLNGELHVLSFVHNRLSSRRVIISNRKGTKSIILKVCNEHLSKR